MTRQPQSEEQARLEDEFFHRVDQELWQQLRDKAARDRRIAALRDATGIEDDSVLVELDELGLGEESLLALSLYPVVRVAWADGNVSAREREAVLEASGTVGCGPGTPGHHLLEVWLTHQPPEALHTAWRDYVHAVGTPLRSESRQAMKRDVLARARAVAEASGGILGLHKVSRAEEKALAELAREFDEAN